MCFEIRHLLQTDSGDDSIVDFENMTELSQVPFFFKFVAKNASQSDELTNGSEE
jgi:hypothetical protein